MLYTHQSGSPISPAVVFLHGGGLSSQMWQPVIERLPEFCCLAPDLPEHGHSRGLAPFDLDDGPPGGGNHPAASPRPQSPPGWAFVRRRCRLKYCSP